MSEKIPRIPQRKCWIDGDKGRTLWNGKRVGAGSGLRYPRRVIVTDARDITPEKAVEKVLQARYDLIPQGLKKTQGDKLCAHAKAAGMSARVVNGKVRVRMAKQ